MTTLTVTAPNGFEHTFEGPICLGSTNADMTGGSKTAWDYSHTIEDMPAWHDDYFLSAEAALTAMKARAEFILTGVKL